MSYSIPATHAAAAITEATKPFEIIELPTPVPGPNEVLVKIKAVAMNPLEIAQRNFGFAIGPPPTVVGADFAGIIVACGKLEDEKDNRVFKPGTEVLGVSEVFSKKGINYGAFQEYAIVPTITLSVKPEWLSFPDATLFPLSTATFFTGLYCIGLPIDKTYTPEDKQTLLIWGAGSCMGSAAVQIASQLGFVVYATSSPQHHDSLKALGAHKVFDYRSDTIVDDVIAAVQADGVAMTNCYLTVGDKTTPCAILRGLSTSTSTPPMIASAPHAAPETIVDGVTIRFTAGPWYTDSNAGSELRRFMFREFLQEKLAKKELVPTPKAEIFGSDLSAINGALDRLLKGVVGTKLVVELP